jgi:hypothetical protein
VKISEIKLALIYNLLYNEHINNATRHGNMATLTYWKANSDTEYDADSLRAPTRKALVAMIGDDTTSFGQPYKVVVTYTNAFDLMLHCKYNSD